MQTEPITSKTTTTTTTVKTVLEELAPTQIVAFETKVEEITITAVLETQVARRVRSPSRMPF